MLRSRKNTLKARIGLYSAGLHAYWDQFDGLYNRLMQYNNFISSRLCEFGEVYNFGMVDTAESAMEAGEYFASNNVDIIFCHSATYFTSSCILPIHQRCTAPAVILNLQPVRAMEYEKTSTGEWLSVCVACPIPEASNAFERANIPCRIVNGLLGLDHRTGDSVANDKTDDCREAIRAWNEIGEWCRAAEVVRTLKSSTFGFLGNYYSGMLDMYSDLTQIQAQTGINMTILEMCDLEKALRTVTDEEAESKKRDIEDFFEIGGDSPSDPIAHRPSAEQMNWASKVAVALDKLVTEHHINALAYYYHGQDNYYEEIQSGMIVGNSILTADGIPCAGEADIKTALAMKISDILDVGGSFCEIVAADYERNTMVIGHDGPFHFKISNRKPILRGMGIYHGKRGSGISVEAKVRSGVITTLGITQLHTGSLVMNISKGCAIDEPILLNGNTSTHVRFDSAPAEYMDKWFRHAPTHHFALSVGDNIGIFSKVGSLLDIPVNII